MSQCKSSLTAVCAAVAVVASLLAAPLAAQAAGARERVIVAFKGGAADAARAAIVKAGGRVLFEIEDLDAFAVSVPKGAAAALRAARGVDYVEEDQVRTIQGERSARKSGITPDRLGGTPEQVPYGISLVQANQITGTPAWTPTVCIVDSGINKTHEDLVANTMNGKNFSGSGTWDTDENSHGTHVAGTIAAVDNTVGVVGVNGKNQVKLYISKVFDATGSASSSTISRAMTACLRANANVVSMSLGGSSASRSEQRAADKLTNAGVLVIAAAGNAGTNAISYPAGFTNVMSVAAVDSSMQWASFSQFNADVEIAAPGVAVESTVPLGSQIGASTVVGGTNFAVKPMAESPLTSATGPLADFGFGDTVVAGSMIGKICLISRGNISFADKVVNCTASGGIGAVIYNNTSGDLLGTMNGTPTTIPSVGATQADGATMLTKLGQSTTVSLFHTEDQYAQYNGTSMATPHVSGVAALVWSYYPQCTGEQIRSTLKLSALDIGDPGRDDKTGAGLVQAKAAYDRIASLGCGN